MTRSLADLRSQPRQSRPERAVSICLAPDLVAEVQSLLERLGDTSTPTSEDDGPARNPDGTARKMAQGEDPRDAGIRARLAELLAEMAEHEGEMRVRGTRTDGEWWAWCNSHPARTEGEPGHERDMRF